MILAAGLSPAWQQIMLFDRFEPGQVNRAREVHWCASGKVLNVGIALHHLGAECQTLSLLGGAPMANIEQELALRQMRRRWVTTAADTRTCTTILDRASGATTELVENAASPSPAELAEFVTAYRQEAAAARIVVLTGSLPAGTPSTYYRQLLQDTPGEVILDVRGAELLAALESRPRLVKPNREELAATLGRTFSTDDDLLGAMREIIGRGASWILVTQGVLPAWLLGEGRAYRLTPPEVKLINPIGCGDCLAAGTAWRLDAGDDMPRAVRFGMAAAAENATMLLPARLDPLAVERRMAEVSVAEM